MHSRKIKRRRTVWCEVTDDEPKVGQRCEVAVEGRGAEEGAFCYAERRRKDGPKAFWTTDGKNLARADVTHFKTWIEIDRPEGLFELSMVKRWKKEESTVLPF